MKTETTANPFQPRPSAVNIRRQLSNGLIVVFATIALLLAVGMLFYLLIYVLRQGIGFITVNFFTQLPTPNGEPGGAWEKRSREHSS